MKNLILLSILVHCVNICSSARILAAILIGSYSNQAYFQIFWRELALRGHEVIVLTTHPTHENLTNLIEIDMSDTILVHDKAIKMVIENNEDKFAALAAWHRLCLNDMEAQYSLPQVQNIISNPEQKFDLIIAQMGFPAYHVLNEVFKCPVIGVNSMEVYNLVHHSMGNPMHSTLYPFSILRTSSENMFYNRLIGFFGHLYMFENPTYYAINQINRKYIRHNISDTRDIMDKLDMLFINNNPLFNEVRPVTPSTISLAGGMHIKPPKKLPADLKKFLDESTQGVVYFSLGSNIKSKDLSNAALKIFIETFSQVPYNILWKFEDGNLDKLPDNVKIIQWAPQQDVLRHINVKLFITQAGLQSLEEALYTHVPVIAIPFISDQYSNAERIEAKEVGIKINYNSLSVQELKQGIIKVITDPKYKNNMKRIAELIQDQPMTPLERAVWWTEYILRHKTGEHLKGPKIPSYQYWYIDILAFLCCCIFVILIAVYYICKLLFRICKIVIFKRILKLKSH